MSSETWKVLAATHLLAAGAGFALAPRELLETEVRSAGFFTTDTKRVLSAAVESFKAEGSLVVFRYKGFVAVSTERDGFLVLNGRQDLIVSASVQLMVDLSQLSMNNVTYDEAAKLVTVHLPPLTMSDVAFEPEGARTLNGGLLSFRQSQVDQLTRSNYATARRAFHKSAQSPALVQLARTPARKNVENYFQLVLRTAGLVDVRVVATFDDG